MRDTYTSNFLTKELNFENEYQGEDGLFDPTKDINHDNDRVKLKVPEHLRGPFLPKDINSFIKEIYPNLLITINNQLFNYPKHVRREYSIEILSNFCIHILANNRHGQPRWKDYDPSKYKSIPYYRWFFTQASFMVKTFKTKHYEEQRIENLTSRFEFTEDDSSIEHANNKSMSDAIEAMPISETYMNGYERILSQRQKNSFNDLKNEVDQFCSNINLVSSNHTYSKLSEVYLCLLEGLTPIKIANLLKLKREIVHQNISKIKQIIALCHPNIQDDLHEFSSVKLS